MILFAFTNSFLSLPNIGAAFTWVSESGSVVTQELERLKKLGFVHRKRYKNVFLSESSADICRGGL